MKNLQKMFLAGMLVLSSSFGDFSVYAETRLIKGSQGSPIQVEEFGTYKEPWAMTFLPDGRMLITEKGGRLLLVSSDGMTKTEVKGIPKVAYGGQGGLGDIVLHPDFKGNSTLYFSFAEEGNRGTRGAAVAMAKLETQGLDPELENVEIIWRQEPKTTGSGHYSHRIAIDSSHKLFITSGERQKQQPSQEWSNNLGKIVRLNDDGSVPADNPFQENGSLAKSFYSLGHRNVLGIAFDHEGKLWAHEMGPRHGDELNLIIGGENYGWPLVSWGNQYYGADIPDHDTRPEFKAPAVYWVPTIAPSGFIIYDGKHFDKWKGDGFIGGLASESLVRIAFDGEKAVEAERFDMKERIREVEQGPQGAIWLLEDGRNGRLLKITKP